MFISKEGFEMLVDVTAQRLKNTTYEYTNNNGKSMLVLATFRCVATAAGGVATAQAKSDTASPPTEAASGIVGTQAGLLNLDILVQVVFLVEPGATYRIDTVESSGSVTLDKWFEGYLK